MSMSIQTDSDGCPVGVACPMDGFQTDCPFLWTKDCPHWHPIGTIDDLINRRKRMNHAEFNITMQKLGQAEENLHIAYRQACITISTDLKKFNEAMCELRQAEENLHKALRDVYAAIHSEDFVAEVLKVSRPSKEDILKYIEENKY